MKLRSCICKLMFSAKENRINTPYVPRNNLTSWNKCECIRTSKPLHNLDQITIKDLLMALKLKPNVEELMLLVILKQFSG